MLTFLCVSFLCFNKCSIPLAIDIPEFGFTNNPHSPPRRISLQAFTLDEIIGILLTIASTKAIPKPSSSVVENTKISSYPDSRNNSRSMRNNK